MFSRAADLRIARLSGGANNLVFLGDDGSSRLVIKSHPQLGGAGERRFRAESEFLRHANDVAADLVPRVVATDHALRAIAMEELVGTPFGDQAPPTAESVAAAARLLTQLNRDRTFARTRITLDAADGFQALSEHRRDIERRVNELTAEHLAGPLRTEGNSLIAGTLKAWEKACGALDVALGHGAVADELDALLRCVSPSDFGFHNAVHTTTGTRFFDFEFAGWDDPAKCLADVFLQPRISVPESFVPV
ncbi:MAG: hypothetical protein FJX59_19420, partial [Alphaproteobacteria bacterium]|nr:hypothetical protein [Alphaproteobacteria bacterium]